MDVFYDTSSFTLQDKKRLLYDIKDHCYLWKLDRLDSRDSWRRKPVLDVSYGFCVELLKRDGFFTIIHRRPPHEECIEVGYRQEKNSGDYFFWVYLKQKHLEGLTKKYNLKAK